MRVAALYDVHGMPWALEAVLAELAAVRVDAVVFGGDFVCGPYPRRTVDLVRSVEDAQFARGNCEREPGERERAEFSDAEVEWLERLPMTVTLDGVLYCHSTPEDDSVIVSAATPAEARTTLRRARAIRPWRPITLPTSSGATCSRSRSESSSSTSSTRTASGSSTSRRAR